MVWGRDPRRPGPRGLRPLPPSSPSSQLTDSLGRAGEGRSRDRTSPSTARYPRELKGKGRDPKREVSVLYPDAYGGGTNYPPSSATSSCNETRTVHTPVVVKGTWGLGRRSSLQEYGGGIPTPLTPRSSLYHRVSIRPQTRSVHTAGPEPLHLNCRIGGYVWAPGRERDLVPVNRGPVSVLV